jgi:outer membrane protein OmpU
MKKILLATTVLAMSAGFAAADVSVSGDGRMGVVSSDGVMTFSNRMRIKFSGSGTTDGGLSFGGSFRAHEAATAESAGTKGSVFISGAFGKVTMGSVDSGDAASVGQLASVGYTGLGSGNSISYAADAGGDNSGIGTRTDAGGARVLYTYSAGALTVNASSAQLTDGGATAYGIGGSYTSGAMTIGLGYGVVNGGSLSALKSYGTATGAAAAAYTTISAAADSSVTDLSLSASYVMGATTVKAIYQAKTLDASIAAQAATTALPVLAATSISTTATSMGMSVVHKIDALSLTAYAISTELDIADALSADNPTVSRYGVGFGYDLGGGASVVGGWATVDAVKATAITAAATAGELQKYTASSVGVDKFDLGLSLSF